MPSGDAQRTWFPEMVVWLRSTWHEGVSMPTLLAYETNWMECCSGECSDRLLHCEDGAEPGRALDNALISLRSFGQRVGLDYRFNFSLGYVI